jgi:hypothetical protein
VNIALCSGAVVFWISKVSIDLVGGDGLEPPTLSV